MVSLWAWYTIHEAVGFWVCSNMFWSIFYFMSQFLSFVMEIFDHIFCLLFFQEMETLSYILPYPQTSPWLFWTILSKPRSKINLLPLHWFCWICIRTTRREIYSLNSSFTVRLLLWSSEEPFSSYFQWILIH